MLWPNNFSEDKEYPIVLFLHGACERGNDNESQLINGGKLFTNEMNRDAFPAIVLFPQCPKDDFWSNTITDRTTNPVSRTFPNTPPTKALNLVMLLMESYLNKPYVNKEKVYVGGLLMGGMGTFEILYRKPDVFAAAISICSEEIQKR
ncbi:hypothetical protein SAMN05428642_103223 [Flaviramulus basaltis]|uniref:Uncharacterized protein n=1 Tax=Flaviramulus basaltis TaxID=369401 RepID=A0A1K2IPH2_9FLAO|nr:hypothetical protein [Flaviramulus basaltis]SFZ93595.1 hypothetical protein SAMN05428642_103223 [Flaviramulus basaltis]